MKTQIVVVKLGWVLVGQVATEKDSLRIQDAAVVRVWGTTKGLGEIALGGPTKETKLDKLGQVVVQKEAVLFCIDCDGASWVKHL